MIELNTQFRGKIGVTVVKKGEIVRRYDFPNLITNSGLDLLGTTSSTNASAYCFVGSGTTTPAYTDTTLVSPYTSSAYATGTTTSNTHLSGSLPYYYSMARTYTFAIGAIVGNVSEVGFFNSLAGSKVMFSRALIKDIGGSPTTITIQSDEQLVISYEVIKYLTSISDVTGSISLGGTSYSYTIRPCNLDDTTFPSNQFLSPSYQMNGSTYWLPVTAYATQTLGDAFSNPSGTALGTGSVTFSTYSNGNYYRDATVTVGPSTVTSSIGSFSSTSSAYSGYQISFSPVIPKTSINQLQLTYRNSWSRYVP